MGKKQDVEDLLDDEGTKPAKKSAAKKATKAEPPAPPAKKGAKPAAKAEPAAPAKKGAAKKGAAKEEPEEKPKRVREPVVFEEGEQDEIRAAVAKVMKSKKPINSKDLAAKIGTQTRKLRRVLYSMARAGEVELESGESRVLGMTVHPA